MRLKIKISLFILILPVFLCAAKIETFYGPIEVEEPVLLELIESPSFQRLKLIHQLGVSYYTTHREEFTRYDHSLGVFSLLRAQNCSLTEQIAGLLHDVSHTVFSHVGDWIFDQINQEKDYQNSIHENFLIESGLATILEKYNISPHQVLPVEELFPALEQKSPSLCADRIDYNIQGAYHQHFITREEAIEIFQDLQFVDGSWISRKPELMKKIVRHSLFMTQGCWGSAKNHLASQWLADAILRGIDLGILTYYAIHFSTDQEIWDRLILCEDPIVQEKMQRVIETDRFFILVDPSQADLIVKGKFRGIDPLILSEGKPVLLTTLDSGLADEFTQVKERMEKGWAIKMKE